MGDKPMIGLGISCQKFMLFDDDNIAAGRAQTKR
jgi:hypothetical protein